MTEPTSPIESAADPDDGHLSDLVDVGLGDGDGEDDLGADLDLDADLDAEPGREADGDSDRYAAGEADDEDYAGSRHALFEGDQGTLTMRERRTLHALLKRRYVSESTTPELWQVLLDAEDVIRSRLNDVFLQLHLDRTHNVAYKRQARPEGGGVFPTLLHDGAYNREETLVLILLRQISVADRSLTAETVFVDHETLLQRAADFRPSSETDLAGFDTKISKAIASLVKAKLIIPSRDRERYRVERIIDALMPVAELERLLGLFRQTNSKLTAPPDSSGDSPPDGSADSPVDRLEDGPTDRSEDRSVDGVVEGSADGAAARASDLILVERPTSRAPQQAPAQKPSAGTAAAGGWEMSA